MKDKNGLQIIEPSAKIAPCNKCGKNIADVSNFIYSGLVLDFEDSKLEYNNCKKCETLFAIEYRFFDNNGHINKLAFTSDINKPEFEFSSLLSANQKAMVENHMAECPSCQTRRDEEILTDAWLGDFFNDLRRTSKKSIRTRP